MNSSKVREALSKGVTRHTRDHGEPDPSPAIPYEVVFTIEQWREVQAALASEPITLRDALLGSAPQSGTLSTEPSQVLTPDEARTCGLNVPPDAVRVLVWGAKLEPPVVAEAGPTISVSRGATAGTVSNFDKPKWEGANSAPGEERCEFVFNANAPDWELRRRCQKTKGHTDGHYWKLSDEPRVAALSPAGEERK